MNPILSPDTYEHGTLMGAFGYSEFPVNGRRWSSFDEVILRFASGTIGILANADDDSIIVSDGREMQTEVRGLNLARRSPWKGLLGSALLWTWTLTNTHGYVDGVQFEFIKDGQVIDLQLLCEASSLMVRTVTQIYD